MFPGSKSPILLLIATIAAGFATSHSAAEELLLEGARVAVVIRSGAPLRSAPAAAAELVGRAELGDVLWMVERIDGGETRPSAWYPTLLPPATSPGTSDSWRLAWIYAESLYAPYDQQLTRCDLVTGRGAAGRESYEIYGSVPDGEVIATWKADDLFVVAEFRLRLGSGAGLQLKVTAVDDDGWPIAARSGWVDAASVSLSYADVLWGVANFLSQGSDDELSAAERVFRVLLERYPEHQFLGRSDPVFPHKLHAGTAALRGLASLFERGEQYREAIAALREITERFGQERSGVGVAGATARLEMARIYQQSLGEPLKALAVCQEVIRLYPNSPTEYYEYASTADLEAIRRIGEVGEAEALAGRLMEQQYAQAASSSEYPVVKVLATIKQAMILRREGELLQAVEKLSAIIERFPDTGYDSHWDGEDLSVSAFDLLLRIYLEDLDRPQQALAVCYDLFFRFPDSGLRAAAMLLRLEILDRCGANRERLIAAGERFLANHRDWTGISAALSRHREDHELSAPVDEVERRLEELRSRTEAGGSTCRWSPQEPVSPRMLIDALRFFEADVIEKLLDSGADVNAADADGRTALVIACGEKLSPRLIRLLLDRGAAIEAGDEEGRTPFAIAAGNDQFELMKILREHGADLDAADADGRTPLVHAVRRGAARVADFLISRGADVDLGGPIVIAAGRGDRDLLAALLAAGADVDARGEHGRTALLAAVAADHRDIVRLLLERGADVMIADDNGRTALEEAYLPEREGMSELLIHGADSFAPSAQSGELSPLLWAAWAGNVDAVRTLLEKGADVNAASEYEVTPLMEAAKSGYTEIAELLIAHGADVNAQSEKGWSPLMWASEKGYEDLIRVLLAAGADTGLVNRRGESASVIARKNGYARLAALIDGRIWARAAPAWMKSWQLILALLLPLLLALLIVYRLRTRS